MKNVLILHGDTPAGKAAIQAAQERNLQIFTVLRSHRTNKLTGVRCFELDGTDHGQVEKLADELAKAGVEINILITCPFSIFAVDTIKAEPFEDMAVTLCDEIISKNLKAPLLFCKIFGKNMLAARRGRIIQLVSNVSIDPHDPRHFEDGSAPAAYAAAMGGLQALSRHLAAQYQDRGVLINNIIYGPLLESESKKITAAYAQRIPLGRLMTQQDLANTIDLLLDPGSTYITGQNIIADGGVSIW